jgi:N-methylhydantoinase A
VYDDQARTEGVEIDGPAIVTTRATTFLVEPGWSFRAVAQGAVWFIRK